MEDKKLTAETARQIWSGWLKAGQANLLQENSWMSAQICLAVYSRGYRKNIPGNLLEVS